MLKFLGGRLCIIARLLHRNKPRFLRFGAGFVDKGYKNLFDFVLFLGYNVALLGDFMQLQLLLQALTQGYSGTITDEDGTERLVAKPPNTHMLQAAKVITELYQQNEQLQDIIRNQQYQINILLKDSKND